MAVAKIPLNTEEIPVEQILTIAGDDYICLFQEHPFTINNIDQTNQDIYDLNYLSLAIRPVGEDTDFIFSSIFKINQNIFEGFDFLKDRRANWTPISLQEQQGSSLLQATINNIRDGLVIILQET